MRLSTNDGLLKLDNAHRENTLTLADSRRVHSTDTSAGTSTQTQTERHMFLRGQATTGENGNMKANLGWTSPGRGRICPKKGFLAGST